MDAFNILSLGPTSRRSMIRSRAGRRVARSASRCAPPRCRRRSGSKTRCGVCVRAARLLSCTMHRSRRPSRASRSRSSLSEVIDRFKVSAVVHGHAHRGRYEGRTPGGAPVYGVGNDGLDAGFAEGREHTSPEATNETSTPAKPTPPISMGWPSSMWTPASRTMLISST